MFITLAGVGLMEIITEPDFRSAEEVSAFVKELALILTTIGTCSGKMEGSCTILSILAVASGMIHLLNN